MAVPTTPIKTLDELINAANNLEPGEQLVTDMTNPIEGAIRISSILNVNEKKYFVVFGGETSETSLRVLRKS